ncbi:MAG: cupin domain-containing protein [Dehalococcoidia bacterium]
MADLQVSGIHDPKRIWVKRSGTFTGDAWGEPRITEAENVGVNTVQFGPNSRTYWHSHEGGQILVVVAGRGIIGLRDGTVIEIQAGDVIHTAPGVDHYHGALSDSFLMHEAISIGETTWKEEVSDADYGNKKK